MLFTKFVEKRGTSKPINQSENVHNLPKDLNVIEEQRSAESEF